MEFIKDFYYGDIKPADRHFIRGPKYQILSHQENEILEDLKTRLSEQDMILINKLSDCLVSQSILLEETHYISGFCDGAKMMIDVLQGGNHILGGGEKAVMNNGTLKNT